MIFLEASERKHDVKMIKMDLTFDDTDLLSVGYHFINDCMMYG